MMNDKRQGQRDEDEGTMTNDERRMMNDEDEGAVTINKQRRDNDEVTMATPGNNQLVISVCVDGDRMMVVPAVGSRGDMDVKACGACDEDPPPVTFHPWEALVDVVREGHPDIFQPVHHQDVRDDTTLEEDGVLAWSK